MLLFSDLKLLKKLAKNGPNQMPPKWAQKIFMFGYLKSKLTYVATPHFDLKHQYFELKINLRPQKGNLKILKILIFKNFKKVRN